ncbi:DEAD/DEAH box helicase [Bacillus benzoevorans]|uniref:SNF2 family DNA or RNA helicase n=1 Tax=Bacillus benzoevorans TaxID=1456 RepID=A0A7X0HQQ1_9BACI|nr:DEAD/DEAH box helicase [Bacillus benzoevorans]MBB6444002.1 SNF2 family DNA or RNA helicase [Bacillus benzoevorans]
MKLRINQKMIKDMCGNAAFKRGEAYYYGNKVTFQDVHDEGLAAVVSGTEDFHVILKKDGSGKLASDCTCPKLSSFQKECQHVAAVLIALHQQQNRGNLTAEKESFFEDTQESEEGLMAFFRSKHGRSSARQRHFETRKVLRLFFQCQFVTSGKHNLLALALQLNSIHIKNIRRFLHDIQHGNSSELTAEFTYEPELHCFELEEDEVLEQLYLIAADETMYLEGQTHPSSEGTLLTIPPSALERLLPLLERVSSIVIDQKGKHYEPLSWSNHSPPLKFALAETGNGKYTLQVHELSEIVMMDSYQMIFFKGTLFRLTRENYELLVNLQEMMETTGKEQIPIHQDQVSFFMEKVVPGLKKIGDVQFPRHLENHFKTPLSAKLFLDRVNNRLLAGLEFHYERIIINPLEEKERTASSNVVRDTEKEEEILRIMEESEFAKTDSGYYLYNEELEYEFLLHVLPKMKSLVQTYATTAIRDRVFKGHAKPRIRVKVYKERINWLEFKFEMDGIPEQQIRNVLAALEEKRKYYRLKDGALLSLETSEFEKLKRFLYSIPKEEDWEALEKGLDVPVIRGLQLMDSVEDQEFFMQEESFRQFLDDLQHPEKMKFELPPALEHVLRDYQKHGFSWMKTLAHYGFGGILADSMGLGKTLQSMAFIVSELESIRSKKAPVLVVCPSSLTYNWLSEFMKFVPEIGAIVVDGQKAERESLQKDAMEMDVVITSYPLLRKDIKWYERQKFHTVFFDEAQAFKNPLTETARAAKKIQAQYYFALTGTPVENALEELWSIFHVIFPELFCGLKEYSKLTRAAVARRVRPFILRRMKEDVLRELPEKMETLEATELLPEQKKLYAAYLAKLRHDTLKHLDKDTLRKNRIKILAGLTRLRQICCHPGLFVDGYNGSSAKLDRLLKIVEEAGHSGRRLLIFSQFTKMLGIIARELAASGHPFFYLDGQTPSSERVELCNRFNQGERDFFLISLKAGGTGLNLTGADTVILYDLWWNPAVEEQAADRAHRMGQKNTVQVIKLIARGTIEEKMNELQDKKRHLVEEIMQPTESAFSSLTEEDIRELLLIE